MCLEPFKIRSVNPVAPKSVFVPCGNCEQCRNSQKNSWSMRLSLELSVAKKLGWSVGFCTLTYDDEHLPRFPDSAFDQNWLIEHKDITFANPLCFDRKQVRDFVVNLRRDLDSDFKAHGLKYMICSEYGSHTQRPHYHCVFAWPPKVSDLSFFELIKKYWKFGFVFPKDFRGGRDSHGYLHQPFVVSGDSRFAAAYAGKYCCKDMDFVNSLKGIGFDRKSPEFRNGDCFHIQNKSLGLSFLAGKSDDELRRLVLSGVSFAGDEKLHQLPLYLRNRIYFTPFYIIQRNVYYGVKLLKPGEYADLSDDELLKYGFRVEYKRLVRRQCTDFFHKHYKEIFSRKVDFWSKTFSDMTDVNTFPPLDFGDFDIDKVHVSSVLSELSSGVNFTDLARFYVSRFGIAKNLQYDCADCDFWTFRYTMSKIPSVFKRFPLLSGDFVDYYSSLVSIFLGFFNYSFPKKSDLQKRIDKFREMVKHKEY